MASRIIPLPLKGLQVLLCLGNASFQNVAIAKNTFCKEILKVSLEDLRALPQKRLQISFNEPSSSIEVVKPLLGDLVVVGNTSGAQVVGKINTLLKLVCHSCLRQFFQPLSLQLDETFVYEDYLNEGAKESRDRELLKDDFVESVSYSGFIDVSDLIYQAVTLAIPSFCSCGSDCPGLSVTRAINNDKARGKPSKTGRGENIKQLDPRWQNLKKLLPKEEEV